MILRRALMGTVGFLGLVCCFLNGLGETVILINGDRMHGKVVSLDGDVLSLESTVFGRMRIPRSQLARIEFVEGADNGPGLPAESAGISAIPHGAGAFSSGLNSASNADPLIQQIQNQFLATASPEANEMYSSMVRDVMSGRLQVPKLKSLAEDTVRQVEDLKADLGDDVGFALDGYLNILKSFIKKAESETPSPAESLPKENGEPAAPTIPSGRAE